MHIRSLLHSRQSLSEYCCALQSAFEKDTSTVCYLQAGQLWALQSHVDRACNDAAIYRGRCQKHDDVLQASDRKLLDLQRQLKLAKSRMISLQSSSMEAENETRQLKLSNHRVQKGLQASKVRSTCRITFSACVRCRHSRLLALPSMMSLNNPQVTPLFLS